MRFAYADPPYIGLSAKLYGGEEVNHELLIAHLETFDGWALSASMKSLPAIAKLLPDDVLTLSWHKPVSPPMGDHRHYDWEPVFMRPLRNPTTATRTALVLSPPQYTFRPRPASHLIGEKPEGFSRWLFACAGLHVADEFHDLFPGSGAVGRAWDSYCAAGDLFSQAARP